MCVCLLCTGCCPCSLGFTVLECAQLVVGAATLSCVSRRGRGALSSFHSAYCSAGVATLVCRATAARLLVCKQQLTCTWTISQLVSVRTCVCLAFCSLLAYEQDVIDLYLDRISAVECQHLHVVCFLLFSGL